MLRLCLILAIIASLGAAAVSQLKVAKKIEGITTERDQYQKERDTARTDARQSKKDAKQAEKQAEDLGNELTDTKASLETFRAKSIQQEKRANDLDAKYTEAERSLTTAQQRLSKFVVTGVTPEQITGMTAQIKEAREQRDAFQEENKVLLRTVNQLDARLKRYVGEDTEVKLPKGLKGKVVAVDPKWDFVVLNIGTKQGVLKDGKMMINRDGKLVGKVRITSVQDNRSIANLIPGWSQPGLEVMEGDEVLY
jgi:DNA repair exonuclease SbcCD ATPase subunit